VARYEAAGKRKYLYGKTKKAVADRLRGSSLTGWRTWPQGGHHACGEVPGSVAAHRKKEIRVLTPEEAKMLLRAARGRGSRSSRSWPSPPGCVRESF
jgi:hypothetical protein